MDIPNNRESWAEYAIRDVLDGITKSVVATGASSTTLWRAIKAGKVGDTELLFTLATLTGISPWLLAGKVPPTSTTGDRVARKPRRKSSRRSVAPIDWQHNSRGQAPTARTRARVVGVLTAVGQ
jgi:hypothetical protein